jgi:hypothetical protein
MPFTGNSCFHTAALAVVLLLHAAGIWLLAIREPQQPPAPHEGQREFIMVRIQPSRPVPPAAPQSRELPRRVAAAPIRARPIAAPEAITVTPPAPAPTAITESAPDSPQPIDIEALKRSVRTVKLEETLSEKARKQVGTPLQSDSDRTGQGIARAKRGDCLTAFSGAGLLAPLAMAYAAVTDKKDSGCKF